MDNKNRTINKTITQATTDKFTKMKAEEKEALLESLKTNGYKTDEEYCIRQFILGEVKDSGEYTKEEIGHVERSLREAREAGHGDTANSEGGEEGHGNTVSEGGEKGHGYSVSESNVINLLKSLKGVKDEQLCRRQVRRASQRYMNTYYDEGWLKSKKLEVPIKDSNIY